VNETRTVDPGPRIPRQIVAQAAHARELLEKRNQPPASDPANPDPAAPAPASFTQDELLSAPTPEKDASPAYWKGRCNLIEGFRLEEIRTRKRMVESLKEKAAALEAEVASLKTKNAEIIKTHPVVAPPLDVKKYFKPDVLERIGEENAEAILRANQSAMEVVLADRIQMAIDAATSRQAPPTVPAKADEHAQYEFVRALGDPVTGVPNWREVNKDPRFLEWLGVEEAFTGKSRQEVLTEHEKKMDAAAIVAMLKRFLALPPAAVVPATPPATPATVSGNANDTRREADPGAGDGVILTDAQIRDGYSRKGRGKMSPEEANLFDARVAAQMKGAGRG
jgi:hypothetical protein